MIQISNLSSASRATIAACLIGAAIFALVPDLSPIDADDTPLRVSSQDATLPATDPRWIGVASCGATACHGGNGSPGSRGSEYTTWITRDPHAEAYNVLFNHRSQRIAKNLHEMLGGKAAHESQVCLDCHASKPGRPELAGPEFQLSFGVGCESCHGPAEKWIGPHTTFDWQSKPGDEKSAFGMIDTKGLTGRTRSCVKCHIGGADGGDVNHDLIAAGHPRLNFEFGAYHALLPKHWRERRTASDPRDKDKDLVPEFEARAWAIGQIVSAQAALELTALRASTPVRPWPELTEYDCYACHHDLQKASWRQERGYAGRRPGALPVSDWYNFAGFSDPAWQEAARDFAKASHDPGASRQQVAEAARKAAATLPRVLHEVEQKRFDTAALKKWMATIAGDAGSKPVQSWDSAAQTALALQALNHALSDSDSAARDPKVAAGIKSLMDGLEFRSRNDIHFDSPHDFTPRDFQTIVKQLQTQLQLP